MKATSKKSLRPVELPTLEAASAPQSKATPIAFGIDSWKNMPAVKRGDTLRFEIDANALRAMAQKVIDELQYHGTDTWTAQLGYVVNNGQAQYISLAQPTRGRTGGVTGFSTEPHVDLTVPANAGTLRFFLRFTGIGRSREGFISNFGNDFRIPIK